VASYFACKLGNGLGDGEKGRKGLKGRQGPWARVRPGDLTVHALSGNYVWRLRERVAVRANGRGFRTECGIVT